jgi:hypothetical protein
LSWRPAVSPSSAGGSSLVAPRRGAAFHCTTLLASQVDVSVLASQVPSCSVASFSGQPEPCHGWLPVSGLSLSGHLTSRPASLIFPCPPTSKRPQSLLATQIMSYPTYPAPVTAGVPGHVMPCPLRSYLGRHGTPWASVQAEPFPSPPRPGRRVEGAVSLPVTALPSRHSSSELPNPGLGWRSSVAYPVLVTSWLPKPSLSRRAIATSEASFQAKSLPASLSSSRQVPARHNAAVASCHSLNAPG